MHVTHKFARRAKCYAFLNYFFCQKAYKLYDLHACKIFTNHHIVFHENIFSYKSSHLASISNNYVLPNIIIVPLTELVTQTLDQHSKHPYLIHNAPLPTPLRHSKHHYHPLIVLRDYVYNQVTSPNHSSSPSSSSHKSICFPLSILFLIIVIRRSIILSPLSSIKIHYKLLYFIRFYPYFLVDKEAKNYVSLFNKS